MKNTWCVKSHSLSLMILCAFLYFVVGFLMISCGARVPKQTYISKTSLSDVKKVAIIASAKAPIVEYSMDSPHAGTVGFLLVGYLGFALETTVRSGIDSHHTARIKENVDLSEIEHKAVLAFIKTLQEGSCFQIIEHVKEKDLNNSRLSGIGFNAVIRLSLRKISLERTPKSDVKLYVCMHGQMKNLVSGETIWDREETVPSNEHHSLDYYKENGLKELDALLETACRRLAYDFVYLK